MAGPYTPSFAGNDTVTTGGVVSGFFAEAPNTCVSSFDSWLVSFTTPAAATATSRTTPRPIRALPRRLCSEFSRINPFLSDPGVGVVEHTEQRQNVALVAGLTDRHWGGTDLGPSHPSR